MADDTLESKPLDWHRAALIAGEYLASTGPSGYYDFTPEQWLAWICDPATPLHRLNLTAARIEFAAAVRDATASTRFRPDHSAIDRFAAAVLRAAQSS